MRFLMMVASGGAASTHYWVFPKDDLIVIAMEQTMPYSFLTEFAVFEGATTKYRCLFSVHVTR